MMDRSTVSFERDCALVRAMQLLGEPYEVIEDFLTCLEIDDRQRGDLLRIARGEAAEIATGDVIEMNPLTAQPQRRRPRL